MSAKLVHKIVRLSFMAAALCSASLTFASESELVLDKAPVDLANKPSLQRGARYFMNNCVGCHSMQYMRYQRLAEDLGIVNNKGEVDVDLMKATLLPKDQKITDSIVAAMPAEDSAKWFGIAPPDLTLEARVRGADWLYTYLRSFYADPSKPYGVNNLVYPGVGMPHVLVNEQGLYALASETDMEHGKKQHLSDIKSMLVLQEKGRMSPEEYDRMVGDLVNFMVYASEPGQLHRQHMGVWVMVFLVIFFFFALMLKREYWKDVH